MRISSRNAHRTATLALVFSLLFMAACQSGPTREERLTAFDNLEAQQLEATAQAEAQRQQEVRAAAKLRRQAQAAEQERVDKIQNSWHVTKHPSPVNGEPVCAIVSATQTVMYGELATNVFLIVSVDSTYVRTDATFDQAGLDTGIQIDGGLPIRFDNYLNEVTAVVDQGQSRLLSQLSNGSFVTINFAYSPTLPDTGSLQIELPLDAMPELLKELKICAV